MFCRSQLSSHARNAFAVAEAVMDRSQGFVLSRTKEYKTRPGAGSKGFRFRL
jgi:hypothetical protein